MPSIKEKYRRFRQWQQQPFDYQDGHEHHRCCNCGAEFASNYCPRCGQRAILGPINWHNVWQGILDMWGIGARSLPFSLWQLIWRPGNLIRDYISGKRMVSFPPVKMLVVMAVLLFLLNSLLGMNYDDIKRGFDADSNAYEIFQVRILDWMGRNISWTVLMGFSLLIIPVWQVFRQAPRLPRHTLPQGYYIQVFIGVQFLLFMLMVVLLISLIPFLSGEDGSDATSFMGTFALPIMLLVDYKQLFGYGWWGTLWRVLFCAMLSLLICKLLIAAGGVVYYCRGGDQHEIANYAMKCINHLSTIWVLFEIVNVINSRPWQNAHWSKTLWRPVLALVTLLLVAYVSGRLGFDNSFPNVVKSFRQ